MSIKPPPPIFPATGCVTASANPTATAASTALPPSRRICTPTSEANGSLEATIPCRPATGVKASAVSADANTTRARNSFVRRLKYMVPQAIAGRCRRMSDAPRPSGARAWEPHEPLYSRVYLPERQGDGMSGSDTCERDAGGMPRRGGFNGGPNLFRLVHDRPHGFVARVHEALGDAALERQKQMIEIRLGVEKNDGSEENGEALEGNGLQQFVEGSRAARQRDHHVRILEHQTLALVHVAHDAKFGDALVPPVELIHEAGDDADHFAALG